MFLDQSCCATYGRGYAALWEADALLSFPFSVSFNKRVKTGLTLVDKTLTSHLREAVEPLNAEAINSICSYIFVCQCVSTYIDYRFTGVPESK